MLAEEMQAVSKGLEKVEHEFKASESDGPVSEIFHEVTHPHLNFRFYSSVHIIWDSALLANTTYHLEQPSFGQNNMIMQRLVRSCLGKSQKSSFHMLV
jgi:hypothetical protein